MRYRNDDREQQLGNEIAEPNPSGLWKADLADGYQPAYSGEQDTERQQVHQEPLLPNGEGCPKGNQTRGKVDPSHEPVDIVQPWRRVRLAQEHLQRTAKHGDSRDQEQADLNDDLACA